MQERGVRRKPFIFALSAVVLTVLGCCLPMAVAGGASRGVHWTEC